MSTKENGTRMPRTNSTKEIDTSDSSRPLHKVTNSSMQQLHPSKEDDDTATPDTGEDERSGDGMHCLSIETEGDADEVEVVPIRLSIDQQNQRQHSNSDTEANDNTTINATTPQSTLPQQPQIYQHYRRQQQRQRQQQQRSVPEDRIDDYPNIGNDIQLEDRTSMHSNNSSSSASFATGPVGPQHVQSSAETTRPLFDRRQSTPSRRWTKVIVNVDDDDNDADGDDDRGSINNKNMDDLETDLAIVDGEQRENSSSEGGDDDGGDGGRLWAARMKVGKIVNHDYIQMFVIFLIVLNALCMGIATFDFVTEDPDTDQAFDRIDRVFLIMFTVEIGMQLFYLGATLFLDGWLVFDLLIVFISWSFEGLQIIRAFRVFRAFRLITRVKPLRDLVMAIGAVLPRMYAIGALLLLIFYIFSVLFTELFYELDLSQNYFHTLDASLFTCMEMMTLEWGGIAREVMQYEKWAWAPFVAFIALTGFIVFNLIIAVVCDAVAITEKTVRELDGEEPDTTESRLAEAQERIDLLQCHINEMLRTQQSVQDMIEGMAGNMLKLEAERKKSEQQAVDLRIEFERRLQYQRTMESQHAVEYERKLSKRHLFDPNASSSSGFGSSSGVQLPRRSSENSLSISLHSKRRPTRSEDEESYSQQSSPRPALRRRRASHRRTLKGDSMRQANARNSTSSIDSGSSEK